MKKKGQNTQKKRSVHATPPHQPRAGGRARHRGRSRPCRPFDFERAQPHSISNDVLYLGEAFAVNPFGGSFQSWARRTSWWVEGPKGALSWCRVVPLFDLIRVIATHRPPGWQAAECEPACEPVELGVLWRGVAADAINRLLRSQLRAFYSRCLTSDNQRLKSPMSSRVQARPFFW